MLRWQVWATLILILGDLFYLLAICWPIADINPYLVRDIQRSFQILQGQWVFVGPDFSSGSYAPGPFFYFLIAPIVFFTQNPKWVILYLLIFKWCTQIGFAHYFSKVFKVPFLFPYTVLASSTFLMHQFIWPNNASFIGPLFLLFLVVLHRFFLPTFGRLTRTSLYLGVVWGLLMQVHFSFSILLPFLLLLLAYQIGLLRESLQRFVWLTMALFLGVFLVCWPFLLAHSDGEKFGFFYNSDFGFTLFGREWLHQIKNSLKVLGNLSLANIEALVLVLYAFFRGIQVLLVRKRPFHISDPVILSLALCVLLVSPWILADRSSRYFTILFLCTALLLILDCYRGLAASKAGLLTSWLLIFAFAAMARISYFSNYEPLGLSSRCEMCVRQADHLCDFFNKAGISYAAMRANTFELFGPYNENSLGLLKSCFVNQTSYSTNLARRYLLESVDERTEEGFSLFLKSLPSELHQIFYIKNLKLEMEEPGFRLYSVSAGADQGLLQGGNLTYPYEIDPAFGPSQSKRLAIGAINSTEYQVRLCDVPLFCDIYLRAQLTLPTVRLELRSRVLQTKYDLPPISAQLKQVRLKYLCDGKTEFYSLVSKIGASSGSEQNSTFFTPIFLENNFHCRDFKPQSLLASEVYINYIDRKPEHLKNWEYSLELRQ